MNTNERTNYRQKGKNINGKVVKGFIQDATSKLSVGSIPSKFETIIYKNNSSKAFGTSTTRFFENENEKPGPGHYKQDNSQKNIDQSAIVSKKGYGNGFASNLQRNAFGFSHLNSGPGPGQYEQSQEQPLLKTRTQNFKGQSMFLSTERNIKTIIKEQDIPKVVVEQPGPGEYDTKLFNKTNCYFSSFISGTKRDEYLGKSTTPAPGAYNIKRNIAKKELFPHRANMSSFCTPTEKKQQSRNHMKVKYLDKDDKKQEQRTLSPGPGQYRQDIPDLKPEYLTTQQNYTFKEGAKDRFGDFVDPSKEKRPYPAPDAYPVEQITGLYKLQSEKALVSGSAFMSESLRQPYGEFEKKLGPNSIIPYLSSQKKSYHLNLQRKWL